MQTRVLILAAALILALSLFGCTQQADRNAAPQSPTSGTGNYNVPSLPSAPITVPEGNIGAPAEVPEAEPEAPAAQEGTHYVKITAQGFEPREITISKGDKVIWVNEDNYMHTVTSDNGTYLKSNNMSPGDTYEKVFSATSSVAYHSEFKTIYRGTIYVE